MPESHETVTVPEPASTAAQHGEGGAIPDFMRVDGALMVLTWACFLLMTWLLHKLAWKPMIRVLDARESTIRKSLDAAEKARADADSTQRRNAQLLADADQQARRLLEDARRDADGLAERIRANAEQEAAALLVSARAGIDGAVAEARQALQREVADLALAAAERLVRERLAPETDRDLVRAGVERIP